MGRICAAYGSERMAASNSSNAIVGAEVDITPNEEDLMTADTDTESNMMNEFAEKGSRATMLIAEKRTSEAVAEAKVAAEVAAMLVCSVEPPPEELSSASETNRRPLASRILVWAIWLLGISIVMHVLWMAVTGSSMGAGGMWEVFSLLLVVLAQEVLQVMGFAGQRFAARQVQAQNQAYQAGRVRAESTVTVVERELIADPKDLGSGEITLSGKNKDGIYITGSELTREAAVPTVLKIIETPQAGDVLANALCAHPSAPVAEGDTPPSDIPLGDALDGGNSGGKTSWGMDVGAFIGEHPAPKQVPVWDLYAPSEHTSAPSATPTPDPIAVPPTIIITPPVQPPPAEHTADEIY